MAYGVAGMSNVPPKNYTRYSAHDVKPGSIWTVLSKDCKEYDREVYVIAVAPSWAIVLSVWKVLPWSRGIKVGENRYVDPLRIGFCRYCNFIQKISEEQIRPASEAMPEIAAVIRMFIPSIMIADSDEQKKADDTKNNAEICV